MATSDGRRSLSIIDFDILDENDHSTNQTATTLRKPVATNAAVLGELAVNRLHGAAHDTPDLLTPALGKPQLRSPAKENVKPQTPNRPRGHEPRPQLQPNPSPSPLIDLKDGKATCNIEGRLTTVAQATGELRYKYPLALARSCLPTNAEQLSKHLAGQFEWIVALPADQDLAAKHRSHSIIRRTPQGSPNGKRLYFGCNLLQRNSQSGGERHSEDHPANIFTLIATPIEGDEDSASPETAAPRTAGNICDCGAHCARIDSQRMAETDDGGQRPGRTSEVTLIGKNDDIVEQVISLSPANPVSRIEDSVLALDELEEQLEAINAVAQLERVLSPEAGKATAQHTKPPPSANRTPKRAGLLSNTSASTPGTSTGRVEAVERKGSVRKSNATSSTKGEEKDDIMDLPKRRLVTRPASLLPPKPPARSSKPPTVSTFELPGEAVARRLKERREARLSMQATPTQAAAPAPPARPKPSKPPTRPNFELPGEAISRRKRQDFENKLRQQEEDERSRREFKARPIRSSIVPNTLPRENIASRARQGKAAVAESSAARVAPGANKRHSMAVTQARTSTLAPGGSSRSSTTSHSPLRGRTSAVGSAAATQTDRGTSASTGSVGKRSTMSSDELRRQGVRGRDIYTRDNSYSADRERERREREAVAKQAREEAAERSRQLSREWAEKQRRKKLAG